MKENRLDTPDSLERAADLLAPWGKDLTRPDERRMDVTLTADDLKSAVSALVAAHWGYLSAITGIDRPASEGETGEIEVMYTFCWGAAITSLRVRVPYEDARVCTVCDLIPSASFYERELMEMFGVTVEETPNPERLMLPDNWPEGVYPLRKSFSGLHDPHPRGS